MRGTLFPPSGPLGVDIVKTPLNCDYPRPSGLVRVDVPNEGVDDEAVVLVLREMFRSIRSILEGATGSALATGLISRITELLGG